MSQFTGIFGASELTEQILSMYCACYLPKDGHHGESSLQGRNQSKSKLNFKLETSKQSILKKRRVGAMFPSMKWKNVATLQ